MVNVSVVSDTQLLEVVVTSTNSELACKIANSFAKVAPTEIVRITKAGGRGPTGGGNGKICAQNRI